MTGFRYFGRFNPRLNAAVPDPDTDENEQISEEEARRRFATMTLPFDVVPDADPATGFVPWCVTFVPNYPTFGWYEVETIGELGLATQMWEWRHAGEGRLFLGHLELLDYSGEWTTIVPRNNGDWDFRVMLKIWENRPATIRLDESVNGRQKPDFTMGKIETPLVYRDQIEFGEWESLMDLGGADSFAAGLKDMPR